jgi:hypothetical protein
MAGSALDRRGVAERPESVFGKSAEKVAESPCLGAKEGCAIFFNIECLTGYSYDAASSTMSVS